MRVEVRYGDIWHKAEPVVTACRRNLAQFAKPVGLKGDDGSGVALLHPQSSGGKAHVRLMLVTKDDEKIDVRVGIEDVLRMSDRQARQYIDNMVAGVQRRINERRNAQSPLVLPDDNGVFYA